MPRNILVLGGSGQLGRSFQNLVKGGSEDSHYFPDRKDIDLGDVASIESYLSDAEYDVIANFAAYTNVDKAEEEQELAEQINGASLQVIANYAKRNNAILIQVSTDYVFDGSESKPYLESDETKPINLYGYSKLIGEQKIIESECSAVIVRTSWVYSEYGNNFVSTMLRLGRERSELNVVYDQIGNPTYARDLASEIYSLINNIEKLEEIKARKNVSVYNYSNEGVCSWYDFSKAIFEIANIDCLVRPIRSSEFPTKAKRPSFSVLDKSKFKQEFDTSIPYWRDSLKKMLLRGGYGID